MAFPFPAHRQAGVNALAGECGQFDALAAASAPDYVSGGRLKTWEGAMSLRSLTFAAFVILGLAPALGNPLEKELGALSNSCWERTYEAAHLKAHPGQLVTKIRLSTKVQDDGGIFASLGINLRHRGGGGPFDYKAYGACLAKGGALQCPSEWDAGMFSLEKGQGGALKVKNSGMIVNPTIYDSEDIAGNAVDLGKTDDGVWLLSRINDESCALF
jgi:hypothetical protein